MESREYKFRFSSQVIYIGILYIAVVALLGYLLYVLYEGDYISVWFTSFMVAYIWLLTLSIPRRIVVTPEKVSIRCILEIRDIKISDIVKVRKVNPVNLRWVIPLFAGWKFFGYYGTYFDLHRAEKLRFYATEWRYFVEIVDIYDDRYYISCRDRDSLVKSIQGYREGV